MFAIVLTFTFAGLEARAEQTKNIPRIGFLSPTSDDSRVEAFRQGLRELGYADGRNIAIEYRWADGNFERLPQLAIDLVRLKVDIMVAVVTQASLAAKKATSTIPIVMIGVADPEGSALVASLARPGANITGTSSMTAEIVGKQFELLKDTLPKIARVAALWNPANPIFQGIQRKQAENAARALSVQLQIVEARGPEEIDRAFGALSRDRARALIILNDPVFTAERKRIAELAGKYRIPSVSGTLEYTEAGGLMAYGPSFPEMYKRAAAYVDKILKGTKPADLPVERPTKFEFVIHLKAAKQIGLTVPPDVLARADKVIR
ncbi:MAG TPA: ABC transporter substrate-binding protein [Candidatus Binatia bacterium]|nr:ABC transporter substrate-binding protein [Candidatus Binatia bacterium]